MRRLAALVALAVGIVALGGCGSGSDAGDPVAFCERLERLTRNDPFLAFGDTASAADIEAAFEALVARARELRETAPPDVRPAARDYEEATVALDSLLAGAAFDPTQVDPRTYRNEQLAYVEAAQRLERYLTAEC